MVDAPSPSKRPPVTKPPTKPVAAPAQSTPVSLFKKAWKKLDDWNVGLSGKALIILMIVGFLSEIYHKL